MIAPPTFPIVLTNPAVYVMANDPELGLDYSRVVHGDQRFTYERPVVAGDVLVCVTTIADITERVGTGFLTTEHRRHHGRRRAGRHRHRPAGRTGR